MIEKGQTGVPTVLVHVFSSFSTMEYVIQESWVPLHRCCLTFNTALTTHTHTHLRYGPGTERKIRAWYVSGTERKIRAWYGPGGKTPPMIALKIHCPEEGLASNGSGYGPSHHRLNGLVTCDN